MSENAQNAWEPNNAGWGAGVGGLIGSVLGSNGFFGGNGNRNGGNGGNAVTPDQLMTSLGALQGQLQRDSLQGQVAGVSKEVAEAACGVSGAVAGAAAITGNSIAGVKDAVAAASAQNALSLCNLGHNMVQGFASVNQTILLQGASTREQLLQQALDAERARATEMRIQLSEQKNFSGHNNTQILLNQVLKATGG